VPGTRRCADDEGRDADDIEQNDSHVIDHRNFAGPTDQD